MSEALSAISPTPSSQNVSTLRAQIDARVKSGERFKLAEVVALVVPLCAEIAAVHAKGEPVYVHASAIGAGPDGTPHLIPSLARTKASGGRDAAAMAPELATGA